MSGFLYAVPDTALVGCLHVGAALLFQIFGKHCNVHSAQDARSMLDAQDANMYDSECESDCDMAGEYIPAAYPHYLDVEE